MDVDQALEVKGTNMSQLNGSFSKGFQWHITFRILSDLLILHPISKS